MKKLIIILLFFSCAAYNKSFYNPTYNIVNNYDEFDNYSSKLLTGNKIKVENYFPSCPIEINLSYINNSDGEAYFIYVKYVSNDWLFINEGESLVLLVDGDRVGFKGNGSSSHRDTNSIYGVVQVIETATYPITVNLIKRIAYAKKVKVKVVGKYSMIGEFTLQNINNFKRFYDEEIVGIK